MSGQLVAIPYNSFNYYSRRIDHVTLNLSMEEFKDAPDFSRDTWTHNASWAENAAYQYFEKTQYFG